jgi:DNA-binding NtrC family response regulator
VVIPPLRERKEDIPLFIEQIQHEVLPHRPKHFAPEVLRALSAYAWPGNVRELRNVVQRMLVLSQGDSVTAADLPGDLAGTKGSGGVRLEDVEREHILRTLARAGGHRENAAAVLGIHPRTLRRKLQEYGAGE